MSMSCWWLLGLGLFCAPFAWNAVRPAFRPAWRAGLSFFAGWLTAELPFHHLAWQLALAGVWIGTGALAEPPGWVGLGLLLANWAVLVFHLLRGLQSRRALDAALSEQLGLAPDPNEAGPPWCRLLLPWPIRPRGVERIERIAYRQVDGRELHLDLYRARGGEQRARPVFLYLHGGGWIVGNRRQQGLPLLHFLAERGWLTASADYRLAPRATWPAMIADAKHALAWVREHGQRYGADPTFVAVGGGSAGGQLASLLALTAGDDFGAEPAEGDEIGVQACVNLYGVNDLCDDDLSRINPGMRPMLERWVFKSRLNANRARFERASPLHRIQAQAPPFLVINGSSDTMVPLAGALRFARALREVSGAPVVLGVVRGAQHAFDIFPSPRALATVRCAYRFLEHVRARGKGCPPPMLRDESRKQASGQP
ncbi:MAG: alpha/beta hydrolase fold domain-containing protein [Deltaproteobacteria bacterium]|nr:alpha/beta hydrolase fold domain-containing protein [Deltaproteobacteria bacterium]